MTDDWTPFPVPVVRPKTEDRQPRWYLRTLRALFRRRVATKPETMTWEYRRVGKVVEYRPVLPTTAQPHGPSEVRFEGTYEVSAPVEDT